MKCCWYLIFLSLLFSCRKEATYWFSDWQTPIINDTLDLKNLTNDSTLAITNGYYGIQFKRKIASISPAALIEIPDTLIDQKYAISIASISVAPGTSFVNDNKDHIFDLKDAKIRKARVKSGVINLSVLNPLATTTFFEIELPSVTQNSLSLKKDISVGPGTPSNPTQKTVSIDLTGYWIELTGADGMSNNALPSKLKVKTDLNGPPITVTNEDSTAFRLEIKNIGFDYAQGYFGQYQLSDTFQFESKLLKNNLVGNIDLSPLELSFDIENSIKIAAKATIFDVKNYNSETNYTTNLSHFQIGNPFIIQSPTGSWGSLIPSEKNITFDQFNSNLESFVENLGEVTTIRYAIDVNPWGNITGGWDEYFPESKLDVTTSIQMPLNIGLNDLQLLDTFNFSLTQDEDKTNVESASLTFKIENAFPFQGELELYFLDENGTFIQSYVAGNKITSALFGVANADGVQSKYSEFSVTLPSDLLDRLPDIKKLVAKVKLNSINETDLTNQKVMIPENAFMWIKVQSSLKLKNIVK